MNFADVKLIYVFLCAVLGLIILLPPFVEVVTFPSVEEFSELWF